MGCDIHLDCQVRNAKGEWESVAFPQSLDDRNYPWFGILANVRNTDFEPIAYPRGLPPDYSRDLEQNLGMHSFSWLSYREILDYDWSQETEFWDRKIVTLGDFFSHKLQALADTFENFDPKDCRLVFGFDS